MSFELKFSQNWRQLKLKVTLYAGEVSEAEKGLEIVGLQSKKNGLKKGVLREAHTRATILM